MPEAVNPTVVALGGFALGLLLLIVAFANLNRIPGWADDYGAILVYRYPHSKAALEPAVL
ncbi:conserved hypothetical protein [Nocardia seriolae]|nr:conserved hypothetical protein [Nocardia seriolae]